MTLDARAAKAHIVYRRLVAKGVSEQKAEAVAMKIMRRSQEARRASAT